MQSYFRGNGIQAKVTDPLLFPHHVTLLLLTGEVSAFYIDGVGDEEGATTPGSAAVSPRKRVPISNVIPTRITALMFFSRGIFFHRF